MTADPTTAAPEIEATKEERRRRRPLAIVLVAIVLVLLMLAALLLPSNDKAPTAVEDRTGSTTRPEPDDGDVTLRVPPRSPATPEGFALAYPGSPPESGMLAGQGWGIEGGKPLPPPADGATSDPAALPSPAPTEPDPCTTVPEGASLAVTPDPKVLIAGQMSSSLTITNCGAAPVVWTAATKPHVTLSEGIGTLDPAASHDLGFSIDPNGFADANIAFKIKVSEPGHDTYVDVSATELGLAPIPPPPPDPGESLTNPVPTPPDPGTTLGNAVPGGCSIQCITRAWLTPNALNPNLHLEVETTQPAKVEVYLSNSAPATDADGDPILTGASSASSGAFVTQWTTVLESLQPSTHYHIVVAATDEQGRTSYRVGELTTTQPAIDPDTQNYDTGLGCALQCITKTWVTPSADGPDVALEVRTHTPASIQVFMSGDAPSYDADGHPYFLGSHPMTSTGGELETEWHTTLSPLDADTEYHVIVRATDSQGRRSFQAGSFETRDELEGVVVTFHHARVTYDGDSSTGNRGELRFTLGVDDQLVAMTTEGKVHSNRTVHFDDGNRLAGISHHVEDVDDYLPTLQVVGFERDADWISEFCGLADPLPTEAGSSAQCDLKWNVAATGLTPVENFGELADCSDLGVGGEFADDRCMLFETPDQGKDYPRFWVVASIRTLPA